MNALQLMAAEVRGRLIRQLEKTDDAEMLTPAPGLQNHVAWHAGHCAWVADHLIVRPLTGRSELPAGWAEIYGQNCRNPAETSEWASRSELIDLLSRQRDRLIELLAGDVAPAEAGDEALSQNPTYRAVSTPCTTRRATRAKSRCSASGSGPGPRAPPGRAGRRHGSSGSIAALAAF